MIINFAAKNNPQALDLPRTIIELLLQNLGHRSLNLTQLLLGFKERTAIMAAIIDAPLDPKARYVLRPVPTFTN